MRSPPAELRDFLSAFPPPVSRLFRATRRLVLTAAPDANELIYDAYNTVSAVYSFSGRLREAFCHVAAYPAHVNLGFNRGTELPDPAGVLVGSGSRIRHLRITAATELDGPPLRALLAAAVAQGRRLVGGPPSKPTSSVRPTTGTKRRPSRAG